MRLTNSVCSKFPRTNKPLDIYVNALYFTDANATKFSKTKLYVFSSNFIKIWFSNEINFLILIFFVIENDKKLR